VAPFIQRIIPLLAASILMGLIVQGVQGTQIRRLLGDNYNVLFYRELDPLLLDSYSDVFGIAHNAGNREVTIERAMEHGADVIEIDVNTIGGRLYAAHDDVPPWIGAPSTRPIPLDSAWDKTEGVDMIKLDLKVTYRSALDRIFVWILARHEERPIAVSTREVAILEELAERIPNVMRLLSIGSPLELEALQADPAIVELIDGVTIASRLVDADVAGWLQDQELFVAVWTVNDMPRVNELVGWGADAITTDNLAILELLSAREQGERTIDDALGMMLNDDDSDPAEEIST
jgi:glycerophosphoryl diester phosphodiesterase